LNLLIIFCEERDPFGNFELIIYFGPKVHLTKALPLSLAQEKFTIVKGCQEDGILYLAFLKLF